MIEFSIQKKSKKSNARIGILKTPHGEVETPTLVTVATQATVKTLTSEEVIAAKSPLLIANTYHLHLKPGEAIVKHGGGLHTFMQWPKPLMTDSGGFQVFSLGFGKDFGTGKMLKQKHHGDAIIYGQQPKLLKITDEGVSFTSFLDGSKLFLNPKESIRIQEALGADIIFAFDECTSPIADAEYTRFHGSDAPMGQAIIGCEKNRAGDVWDRARRKVQGFAHGERALHSVASVRRIRDRGRVRRQ